ncbi:hypothetical protein [Paenibacillus sp. MMS20-IR301]|uniref:hypothetical protein n=1 Tax=Paenibacillus sp. MMS20-IR301 TaxID=2895946 RepID=UPI0028E2151A|nr:hypothetical protein [Paenibacillus sp. MMS20-IR301]WNS45882.1 hypothetical protein LOS79_11610 [Paenibacillus sp. MMS20-IR301]
MLIAAVISALPGCAWQGSGTDNGSAEVSATPSAAAVQTAEPQATAVNTPAPGTEPPQLAAFVDPAKLKSIFGFADETGSRILATLPDEGYSEQMKPLNIAIGNGGQVLTVKFDKYQPGSDNTNGRELANNIANLSGYLFTVVSGKAEPDETYYLADSGKLPPAALLEIEPAAADANAKQLSADDPVRESIAKLKQREIQSAWKLAGLGTGRELYLVQFIRQDKDMLFSLVLYEDGKLSFQDYPAEIQDNEYSVWRVDDGGEIRPEMFSLLFAAESADGLLLGLNWWGAEGVNTFFLLQKGNAFTELDINYSRYTSPI